MPYNWQVTTGIDYESDEHFVESYYRREFNTGPDRETYIHLKRIEDNWGLAFLGKGRINNFADELEESPTAEYHLTGQSIFDDKLTLYSDTQGGRFRQRIGEHHTTAMNEEFFTFGSHRTELDMPVWLGGVKAVPYVAGTVGYDDRSGFNRSLVDGSNCGRSPTRTSWGLAKRDCAHRVSTGRPIRGSGPGCGIWTGCAILSGLNWLRRFMGKATPVVKQHDVIHLRKCRSDCRQNAGQADNQRTVDWMRLDLGGTWFTDNDSANGR